LLYLFPMPDTLKHIAIQAALEAGQAIMQVYRSPVEVISKPDGSPVTLADRRANQIILDHLKSTPYPVISEETPQEAFSKRKSWERVWLVDPLDGTREFLSGSGEFTVNIALVENGQPVLGVIFAPVSGKLWSGMNGYGSKHGDGSTYGDGSKQQKAGVSPGSVVIGASRSHQEPKTRDLIEKIAELYGGAEIRAVGSSLKFCEMADGRMNIYPRCTSIYEWDTAAGHAILLAAGGEVYSLEDHKPLIYNKENLQNPPFIAFGSPSDSNQFFAEFPLQVRI
jgi:3'(2'), 5'-bisphosphate nucleotidase